jgi:hypothetical protein
VALESGLLRPPGELDLRFVFDDFDVSFGVLELRFEDFEVLGSGVVVLPLELLLGVVCVLLVAVVVVVVRLIDSSVPSTRFDRLEATLLDGSWRLVDNGVPPSIKPKLRCEGVNTRPVLTDFCCVLLDSETLFERLFFSCVVVVVDDFRFFEEVASSDTPLDDSRFLRLSTISSWSSSTSLFFDSSFFRFLNDRRYSSSDASLRFDSFRGISSSEDSLAFLLFPLESDFVFVLRSDFSLSSSLEDSLLFFLLLLESVVLLLLLLLFFEASSDDEPLFLVVSFFVLLSFFSSRFLPLPTITMKSVGLLGLNYNKNTQDTPRLKW